MTFYLKIVVYFIFTVRWHCDNEVQIVIAGEENWPRIVSFQIQIQIQIKFDYTLKSVLRRIASVEATQ